MAKKSNGKKRYIGRGIVILSMAMVSYFLISFVLDQLASSALRQIFEESTPGNVYELHFEKLNVHIASGSIGVHDVVLQPRSTPKKAYPYINSHVRLKTSRIVLEGVKMSSLLFRKELIVQSMIIDRPDVKLELNGSRNIFLPFPDDETRSIDQRTDEESDPFLDAFHLGAFRLSEASIEVNNTLDESEYRAEGVGLELRNLDISLHQSIYRSRVEMAEIRIGMFESNFSKGFAKQISFEAFSIQIDSASSASSADTLLYQFRDFTSSIHNMNLLTADSLQEISMDQFDLSYRNESIRITEVRFKPNVTKAALQSRHEFQKADVSGSFKTLHLQQVNFNELIYHKRLVSTSVRIDSAKAAIYKDKTKPIDKQRKPGYPPQNLAALDFPIHIGEITATHSQIDNTEILEDGSTARVSVSNATFTVKNFTNITPTGQMRLHGIGDLEGVARFDATLLFDYGVSKFDFSAFVAPFDLTGLNNLINAYTPVKLESGLCDQVKFSGIAHNTHADGTMEFLYHDLKLDINIDEGAKWKNAILSFAGNNVVRSSNPGSENEPARVVTFHIDRDMNKAFLNVVIKSLLGGIKETLIMSKENRKRHNERKQLSKEQDD